jgi:hypothetical protein
MTSSNTTNFESGFLIDDIIEEAYNRIGLDGVSGYQMKSARRSLNIMFQEWGNRGLHYWEVGNTSIDLVEGQAEYIFYRSAADGTSATTTPNNGIYGLDDVLEGDRSTYNGLANKLTEGQPSQYYVQRFIDQTKITLYPTPDSTAAGNTVFIYFVKRVQDVGGYSNTADVPYRFVPCMVSGLAYYLSQKSAPERTQNLKMFYEDELNRALTEDGSSSSTYITPQNYYPNV